MKAYWVKYLVDGWYSNEKGIMVPADNKADAYDKAVNELILKKEGRHPFGAYVYSVTYNKGNEKIFNNDYGNAY